MNDEITEETTEKSSVTEKKLHAKTLSMIMKIVAVVGIVVCHIFKWLDVLHAESGEICQMWAWVYALGAGTIDSNIVLDKFRKHESE